MKYDFDKFVSRENTNSAKWNYIKESVGVEDALPMWVADMDFETVPEVKDAIIARAQHNIYGYTARSDEYYEAIINWNEKRHGWKVEKKWITHSSGVVNALFNIIGAFTNPGDGVIIQSPVYHPFYRAIKSQGCKIILNPLKVVDDKYIPDIEDLEEKLKHNSNVKLLVLCNPHNPVGRVFTEEELTAIGELCLKYKVLVVSDEIHSDLVFKQYKHTPFAAISKEFEQNSIICTAPSKTFNLAGLATSNIIIPNEELKKRYDLACEKLALKSYNIFGAVACEAAYKYGEQWLEELLDYIEGNKNYALEFIKERIPKLKLNDIEGTYFLWVDCRELGLNKEELEQFMLHKARLWFNQGHIFGSEGEGFVRINLACQRATVEEAMKRLENAVNSLL
jgi:cystathionine beta-lyase